MADADNSTYEFSLVDDAGGRFLIDPRTGEITVSEGALLDYEAEPAHTITVRAQDVSFGKNKISETFTIELVDTPESGGQAPANSAPTDLLLLGSSVDENASGGTTIGTLRGSDPDARDTLTYKLVDDAGGRFHVEAATGALTVNAGADLDFETQTSHMIIARVTDAGGLSYDETFTIALGDVDETSANAAPYYLTLWGSTVDENSPGGTVVGRLIGKDPDAGDTLTYALLDDAGGRFRVDAASGAVTVTAGADLDFETQSSHTIMGRVTDAGGLTYDKRFAIAVGDVDETETTPGTAPDHVFHALAGGDENRWNAGSALGTPVTVTYTFLDQIPKYYYQLSTEAQSFQPFTQHQIDAARALLDTIESFANVTFLETGVEEAQITFGNANLGGALGWAYGPKLPGTGAQYGDVWINHSYERTISESPDLTAPQPGGDGWWVLPHEIGHALGLSHAGGLLGEQETRQWTVMSYVPHRSMPNDEEPLAYQPYDIAVLQDLYGANMTTAANDTVYNLTGLSGVIKTYWDAGGRDTFDASGETAPVVLDLHAGGFSSIGTGVDNVAIAYDVVIENAVGGRGNDVIIGNAADNRLTGGAGADRFVFEAVSGRDRITDFQNGVDILDFSPTGLTFFQLSVSSGASGALIGWSGGSIELSGVDAAAIGNEDFLFASV